MCVIHKVLPLLVISGSFSSPISGQSLVLHNKFAPCLFQSCLLDLPVDRSLSPEQLMWQPIGVYYTDMAKPFQSAFLNFFNWRLIIAPIPYILLWQQSRREILRICLGYRIWKTSSLFVFDLSRVHVSDPYRRTGRIRVWKRRILVLVEMLAFFQRHHLNALILVCYHNFSLSQVVCKMLPIM